MEKFPHQTFCLGFFDVIFVIAMLHFQEMGCDYVVLECGIGGRYDSTNVIGKSIASAITSVGLDHTDVLGNTLEEIGAEKVQILKDNTLIFATT